MKPSIREKNGVWEISVKLSLERKSVGSLTVGLVAITAQGCGCPYDGGREAGNPFGATVTNAMLVAIMDGISESLGLSSHWQSSLPSFYLQPQVYVGHDKLWIVQQSACTSYPVNALQNMSPSLVKSIDGLSISAL